MKRFLSLALVAALGLALVGCAKEEVVVEDVENNEVVEEVEETEENEEVEAEEEAEEEVEAEVEAE